VLTLYTIFILLFIDYKTSDNNQTNPSAKTFTLHTLSMLYIVKRTIVKVANKLMQEHIHGNITIKKIPRFSDNRLAGNKFLIYRKRDYSKTDTIIILY
jgi:hypothetical protein